MLEKITAADWITYFRVVLCLVSVVLIFSKDMLGLILLPIVFALDYVDGYFARKSKPTPYGKKLDVAGDRIVEYLYYFIYSIIGLIPYFVFPIIIVRNSIVDAFFYTPKKNFSTAKTTLAKIFSSSRISRGLYNSSKALLFFYLGLVIFYGFPVNIGYYLLAFVVTFSVVRGISDIYEVFSS